MATVEPTADERAFYEAVSWVLAGGDIDALPPELVEPVRRAFFCDRLHITPAEYDAMSESDRNRFHLLWQARHAAAVKADAAPRLVVPHRN